MVSLKPNEICPRCGADVRLVIKEEDGALEHVAVNPIPDKDGRVYIDHWERSQPVVFVVPRPIDVPAHVPLRYTLHDETCEAPA